MMTGNCAASWYELNVSGPDDDVSGCCYWHGGRDAWAPTNDDIFHYWNSVNLQNMRLVNSGAVHSGVNGCKGCHYYQNREGDSLYDLNTEPTGMSIDQSNNWRKAAEAFKNGDIIVAHTPLRLYLNFGFFCNLACTMCHQVPRRAENRKTIDPDAIMRWRHALKSALTVDVIGGEPFAIPEALKFIRQFVTDDYFSAVNLTIMTNGTLHHKHMETLREKEKLAMTVSLDGTGAVYERLRPGGSWAKVEAGIIEFLGSRDRDRPSWSISTNAAIHKSSIPNLPDFARWHARHKVSTWFYDFVNLETWRANGVRSYGTDDTFRGENVLANPLLLDRVPGWRDHFEEAIYIFASGDLVEASNSLDFYFRRVKLAYDTVDSSNHPPLKSYRIVPKASHVWACASLSSFLEEFKFFSSNSSLEDSFSITDDEGIVFGPMRSGDYFATRYFKVESGSSTQREIGFRITSKWPNKKERFRRARIHVQRMEDGAYAKTVADFIENERGIEELGVGKIPSNSYIFRLVCVPVGEGGSFVPSDVGISFFTSTPSKIDLIPLHW